MVKAGEAELAVRALKLVDELAPRLAQRFQSFEGDARSAGHEAAARAARRWNGEGSFDRFAGQRIFWAITRALYVERRAQGRRASFGRTARAALEVMALGVSADESAAGPPSETFRAALDRTVQTAAAGYLARTMADPETTPDSRADIERQLDRARLREMLGDLPEEDRALLVRYFDREETLAQIAAATGSNDSTVHRRIREAMSRLRARMLPRKG